MANPKPNASNKVVNSVAVKPRSGSYSGSIKRWAGRTVLLLLFIIGLRWLDLIRERFYVLDPTFLNSLARDAIAASPENDMPAIISYIVKNLTETFPQDENRVISLNIDSSEWVFNNAGGAMGAMYIIHASITEYLFIFGTPLGTEGHTGVHTADDYFNILVGEQWAFKPPNLEMERYLPGSVHFLPRGTSKQYKMHEGCYALEYARGWTPLMLPFGLADGFFSTLDIVTLWDMTVISIREMGKNLLIGKL